MEKHPRKKPVPEVVPDSELYRAAKEQLDPPWLELFFFLRLTGCRISEALQAKPLYLKVVVVKDEEYLQVFSKNLKSTWKKFKEAPVAKLDNSILGRMGKAVLAYSQKRLTEDGENCYLWPSPRIHDRPVTKRWAEKKLQVTLTLSLTNEATGEREVREWKMHPHYLRHVCATWLSEHGADLAQLLNQMGWVRVQRAADYLHGTQERAVKVFN